MIIRYLDPWGEVRKWHACIRAVLTGPGTRALADHVPRESIATTLNVGT